MKKSIEILGLPIISITEGRELGLSKSLLIDAQNRAVAAITIEDDDWYRGVKLIPYEAIIAIGEDAITITHSENILNLDEAGDYERLLVENIRVIGTKAITKSGCIQGKVTEVFIGEGGKIDKCEVTASDNTIDEVAADQISIFGKQVTVIDLDTEKKNNLIEQQPAFEPAFEAFSDEPEQEVWTPTLPTEQSVEVIEQPQENFELLREDLPTVEESPAESQETFEPVQEESPAESQETFEPVQEESPAESQETFEAAQEELTAESQETFETAQEELTAESQETFETAQEESPAESQETFETAQEESSAEEIQSLPELTLPPTEEATTTEEAQAELEQAMTPEPVIENASESVEEKSAEENPVEENPVVELPKEEQSPVQEENPVEENPVVELPKEEQPPVQEEKAAEEDKKIAAMTQQAEDLKAALKKARESQQTQKPMTSQKKQVEKAVDERRRRVLLGKHATKTITAESGTIVVEAGAEVTEEVLQRARLSNKFIELSMNVQ